MTHRIPIEGTLDLHAFAPRDIKSVVEEYVNAAHDAGLGEVRLIQARPTKDVAISVIRRRFAAVSVASSSTDVTTKAL